MSSNISITNNYMSQNRFGIAISDVNGLIVKGNYFSQRFNDNEARKFWTDNSVLLKQVTNLTWENNTYKEAFTQDMKGDNSKSFKVIPFPGHWWNNIVILRCLLRKCVIAKSVS